MFDVNREAMNVSLLKPNLVAIAACSLAIAALAADSPVDTKFAGLKVKMMPQVGHKITAVGKLDAGKAGWWLSFGGWGLYIEPTTTNRLGLAKFNALGRFRLHTVKAVGFLRHQKEWGPEKPMVQGIPEHFFFDVGEVTVTEFAPAGPQVPKRK